MIRKKWCKGEEILANARQENSYRCNCGHSVYIERTKDYEICDYCGRKLCKRDLLDVRTLAQADRIKRYFIKRRLNER